VLEYLLKDSKVKLVIIKYEMGNTAKISYKTKWRAQPDQVWYPHDSVIISLFITINHSKV
jgi:hypothetical protein